MLRYALPAGLFMLMRHFNMQFHFDVLWYGIMRRGVVMFMVNVVMRLYMLLQSVQLLILMRGFGRDMLRGLRCAPTANMRASSSTASVRRGLALSQCERKAIQDYRCAGGGPRVSRDEGVHGEKSC